MISVMTRRFTIAACLLALLLPIGAARAGEAVGDFTFVSIDGRPFTSAGLKGTPLLINVGSDW